MLRSSCFPPSRLVRTVTTLIVLLATVALSAPVNAQALPKDWADQVNWRSIGPANMGGRITSLSVYEKDPSIWWASTASGGLLKTTNNGVSFEHQFDDQATVSVGEVAVAQSDPNIVWVGTGENNPRNSVSWGDGVYKSTDGGKTWKNMGLKKTFQTGAIAIHPKNPDVVYVGSLGRLWGPNKERGLFKTTDGGKTWKKILYVNENTGVVEVQMNPKKHDELLIATYERRRDGFDGNDPEVKYGSGSGIYKTTDAGKSWARISEGLPTCKLGRIGLDYFRKDPKFVYAIIESELIAKDPPNAPFMGISGANGTDIGARLTRVTEGGPAATAGLKPDDLILNFGGKPIVSYADFQAEIRKHQAGDKVKVTVSRDRTIENFTIELAKKPAAPQATNGRTRGRGGARSPFTGTLGGQAANLQGQQGENEHQYGGVYRSKDGGDSWERINTLNPRPMYYSHIRVDPSDRKNIYVCGTSLYQSTDEGKTFEGDGHRIFDNEGNAVGAIHVDHHALWIDSRDSRHMILGNDGGIHVTYDRMQQWDHLNHVAIGQFYHVGVDAEMNYRVYGGLQDNGSWGGPSRKSGGIVNSDWFRVGGGDGFITLVDPNDKDQIFYESQNGGMGSVNLRTGARGSGRPRVRGARFNWKTPFILSPHNSQIFYSAGNRVFRSVKKGNESKAISPDITNTNRGAGSAISESGREEGVIYAGTTDGAVWMTKDGGKEWLPLFSTKAKPESGDQTAGSESGSGGPGAAPGGRGRGRGDRGNRGGNRGDRGRRGQRTEESNEDPQEKPAAEKASDDDALTGTWEGKMTPPEGFGGGREIPEDRLMISMTFKMGSDGNVTGSLAGRRGDTEISDGKFDADSGELTFAVESQRGSRDYTAKIKGNKMTGEMSAGGGRFTMEFEATKKDKSKNEQSQNLNPVQVSPASFAMLLTSDLQGRDDPISGEWKGVVEAEVLPGGKIDFTGLMKLDSKNQITGTIVSAQGEIEILDGSYDPEKKKINFQAENDSFTMAFSGTVDGKKMSGEIDINDGQGTAEFSGEMVKAAADQASDQDADKSEKSQDEEKKEAGNSEMKSGSGATSQEADDSKAKDEEEKSDAKKEAAKDDLVSGTWEGTLISPNNESELTLKLNRKSDNTVSGTFQTTRSEGDVTGKFDPEKKTLVLAGENNNLTLDFTGPVKANEYKGEMSFQGGRFTMDFELKRTSAGSQSTGATASSNAKPSGTKPLSELMPGPRWVSSIEASKFDGKRVYITFDGHRSNDDGVYLFTSEDYGQTWKSIKNNLPDNAGAVRVLREDVVNQNLLFLGCEFSAWVSVDRGQTWNRLSGLPTVAVHEFAIHPKAGEVVAGTHGRSLWIADIRTLRQYSKDAMDKDAHLFRPGNVIRWRRNPEQGNSGTRRFVGDNGATDLSLHYSLSKNARNIELEVLNLQGSVVRSFDELSTSAGIHAVPWNSGQQANAQRGRGGRFRRGIPTGNYLVRLKVDGQTQTQTLMVEPDPATPADAVSLEELEWYEELLGESGEDN